MLFISHSAEETKKFAKQVLAQLKPESKQATILALQGDLGAGKTAFTQGLAHELGIKHHLASPTFVIAKKYHIAPKCAEKFGFKQLIHFDFYRLQCAEDLLTLGWADLATEPQNLIVVEWPEQVGEKIFKQAKLIEFFHLTENERKIKVKWLKKNIKIN